MSCGSFTHIYSYIEFLKNRGHDVRFLAYDRPIQDLGVPTYDISFGASGKARLAAKWKYLLTGLFGMRSVLRQWRPDILHGHYATSAGVICLLSGFRPYVLTVHGSDVLGSTQSPLWRLLLRCAFHNAAVVNPVSAELAAHISQMGVPIEDQLIGTCGVDCRLFPFRLPTQFAVPLRLLCTRGLAEVYDPQTIIAACHILQDLNIPLRLTFAAGGPLQVALERQIGQEGLTEQITFLGGYDQTELPGILRGHDFYLSASRWDGTSISLLEVMASGLFPIVSRIPSNQSWLEENRTAYMFSCGNAVELAECIQKASRNLAMYQDAVRANRLTVEQKADRNTIMSRLEKAYYRIVGE